MARKKVDFDTVRTLVHDMPDVEESTTYGSPCFKARGKLMTCIAVHRSAEPGTLAVRVDFDRRTEMIADAPDVYYLTDHYVNYPFVLVRMQHIRTDALKDLLGAAWRLTTAKAGKRPARKRSPGRSRSPRRPG